MIIAKALAVSLMLAINGFVAPLCWCQNSNREPPLHQGIIISQEVQKQIAQRYEEKAKAFAIFIQSIKEAIQQNKREIIVVSIRYPINVDIKGRQKQIRSPKQMLHLFPIIFTGVYKNQVLADISDLHVLSQGVMLGRGSMWVNLDQKNVNWKIITINN